MFEPRRDKMNEFVYIPGYISFQGVSEDDEDTDQVMKLKMCVYSLCIFFISIAPPPPQGDYAIIVYCFSFLL